MHFEKNAKKLNQVVIRPTADLVKVAAATKQLSGAAPASQAHLDGRCPIKDSVLDELPFAEQGRFRVKCDQFEISPAASPEILHHTVWRTWLFIAYTD